MKSVGVLGTMLSSSNTLPPLPPVPDSPYQTKTSRSINPSSKKTILHQHFILHTLFLLLQQSFVTPISHFSGHQCKPFVKINTFESFDSNIIILLKFYDTLGNCTMHVQYHNTLTLFSLPLHFIVNA